jgi:hypothetical protein
MGIFSAILDVAKIVDVVTGSNIVTPEKKDARDAQKQLQNRAMKAADYEAFETGLKAYYNTLNAAFPTYTRDNRNRINTSYGEQYRRMLNFDPTSKGAEKPKEQSDAPAPVEKSNRLVYGTPEYNAYYRNAV